MKDFIRVEAITLLARHRKLVPCNVFVNTAISILENPVTESNPLIVLEQSLNKTLSEDELLSFTLGYITPIAYQINGFNRDKVLTYVIENFKTNCGTLNFKSLAAGLHDAFS